MVLGISYWVVPLFAACTWFGTLLAMLIVWLAEGRPHLAGMHDAPHYQNIPYISDIGASGVKPLFIAGSTVAVVVFDLVFIAERYLRHSGRLAHNTSWTQKILSIFATLFAIVGAAGLILLTIFDTVNHNRAHTAFTAVFIIGYIVSAIFVCAEYQRLGIHHRQHRILRASFWVKLAFIFIEIILAIAFGVLGDKEHYNPAAVLEWVISLFFILYMLSYVVDFLPAISSKDNRFPPIQMESGEVNGANNLGGDVYAQTERSQAASYASTQPITPMQQTTGHHANNGTYLNYEQNVPASRNF